MSYPEYIFYSLALLSWLFLDGKITKKGKEEWVLEHGKAIKRYLLLIVSIYTLATFLEIYLPKLQ
jgi:hypothetical protein